MPDYKHVAFTVLLQCFPTFIRQGNLPEIH